MQSLLAENWKLISENPVMFILLAISFLSAGFAAGKAYYSERINILSERLKDRPTDMPEKNRQKITYPKAGFFGVNILDPATTSVLTSDAYSLAAYLPANGTLKLRIRMLPTSTLTEGQGCWHYTLSPKNWSVRKYDFSQHEQWFEATQGAADVEIAFAQEGSLQIDAFESESSSPSWSRELRVSHDRSRH